MQFENPFGMAELIELGGSAAVVLLMIGVAAFLGFRMSARVDNDELVRIASEEGSHVEASVIAQNGRSALARLADGRIMVARVMGADVSARFTGASNVRLDVNGRRLNAAFADAGFPPLKMRLDDSPAWLTEFSRGGGTP